MPTNETEGTADREYRDPRRRDLVYQLDDEKTTWRDIRETLVVFAVCALIIVLVSVL